MIERREKKRREREKGRKREQEDECVRAYVSVRRMSYAACERTRVCLECPSPY